MRIILSILISISLLGSLQAQQYFTDSQVRSAFLRPDTTLNKGKAALVGGSILGIYGGALGFLSHYWYKDYPRGRFRFFNDGREWMGQDKMGHVYTTYIESRWAVGLFRWTGMKDRNAIIIGGLTGSFLQTSIEILDGFSTKWGFSGYDILANTAGSALVIAQELAWQEQRITLKISASRHSYPADVRGRAEALYGTRPIETALKDYNALTTWASVNISSFMKKDRAFPRWLSVSVGYGANGMLGGFANQWCEGDAGVNYEDCPMAQRVERPDIRRYPQFYLSLDIDFTRIETKKAWLKVLFNLINVLKVPAPTLEFNPVHKVRFHPLFF